MTQRTRLTPAERRAQLLDLGVRLFARRDLGEITIELLAEHAGISRGLLYHYFGSLTGFQEAVAQRAADDLVARTAPPEGDDPVGRLLASLEAYVDYVDTHYEGYVSLLRVAKSGDARMRAIYDEARRAMGVRFAAEAPELVPDTPAALMLVNGWQALAEDVVLAWKADPVLTREELLRVLAATFPAVLTALA